MCHVLNKESYKQSVLNYNHNSKIQVIVKVYSNMEHPYIILNYQFHYHQTYKTLSYLQFYQQTKSKIVNSQFKAQTL